MAWPADVHASGKRKDLVIRDTVELWRRKHERKRNWYGARYAPGIAHAFLRAPLVPKHGRHPGSSVDSRPPLLSRRETGSAQRGPALPAEPRSLLRLVRARDRGRAHGRPYRRLTTADAAVIDLTATADPRGATKRSHPAPSARAALDGIFSSTTSIRFWSSHCLNTRDLLRVGGHPRTEGALRWLKQRTRAVVSAAR
jgi:hypothetical protein